MNFKGIEIKVEACDWTRVRTDAVVVSSGFDFKAEGSPSRYVLSQEIDGASAETVENTLRQGCAGALYKAHMLRVKSLAFGAYGIDKKVFPPLAVAKIIAQEIYRYAREERFRSRSLKEILVVVSCAKEGAIYEKGITGYLEHITSTLEAGPFVTVDVIIEVKGGVVLIERSNPPFGWALPGGFLDYGETLEEAALREAEEETGLTVTHLKQMHTYSDPSRDPRFQTITTVFTGRAKGRPRAASDAANAKIFSAAAWRKLNLAFDHAQILEDYLQR